MKKVVLLLAAAATLAACSKTEVTPVASNEDSEISFNVAPRTKALADGQSEFSHKNVFASYAYFLTNGEQWPGHQGSLYIDNALISYDGDKEKDNAHEGKWHAGTTYYWPKSEQSSLTFFAWSKNTGDLDLTDAKVECDPADGIKFTNYNVVKNQNVDLLVADVAANQQKNAQTYLHTGVPTLFRHKLTYVIFRIKTAQKYANKTFELQSIKFKNINTTGDYSQKASNTTDHFGSWDVLDATADQVYTTAKTPITSEMTNLDGVADQKFYLPQTFADAVDQPTAENNDVIEIVYTITTTEGNSVTTEKVTKYVSAKKAFGDWQINKKYTCNVTLSLDEILWDPAVQDWDEVNGGDITINY